jgi:hypothetical protein
LEKGLKHAKNLPSPTNLQMSLSQLEGKNNRKINPDHRTRNIPQQPVLGLHSIRHAYSIPMLWKSECFLDLLNNQIGTRIQIRMIDEQKY